MKSCLQSKKRTNRPSCLGENVRKRGVKNHELKRGAGRRDLYPKALCPGQPKRTKAAGEGWYRQVLGQNCSADSEPDLS